MQLSSIFSSLRMLHDRACKFNLSSNEIDSLLHVISYGENLYTVYQNRHSLDITVISNDVILNWVNMTIKVVSDTNTSINEKIAVESLLSLNISEFN